MCVPEIQFKKTTHIVVIVEGGRHLPVPLLGVEVTLQQRRVDLERDRALLLVALLRLLALFGGRVSILIGISAAAALARARDLRNLLQPAVVSEFRV